MIDKNSLLKSQGSLYLEFIPKDGLFHKMLLLSLMGFLTGWCNLIRGMMWSFWTSQITMTNCYLFLMTNPNSNSYKKTLLKSERLVYKGTSVFYISKVFSPRKLVIRFDLVAPTHQEYMDYQKFINLVHH